VGFDPRGPCQRYALVWIDQHFRSACRRNCPPYTDRYGISTADAVSQIHLQSIYQNIALPLAIHGTPRSQIPGQVEAALTRVGLWQDVAGRLHTPAQTLSGGQQQRLCIARALAVNPDVLLLDEPASALDPKSRHTIDEFIKSLQGHTTVVLVTHHLEQAREVATHIGVLIGGRLVALGEPDEIFRSTHPAVAQYLHHTH